MISLRRGGRLVTDHGYTCRAGDFWIEDVEKKLIGFTAATWAAIDAARAKTGESRAALIERVLWRSLEMKKTGEQKEQRPKHGGLR